MKKIVFVVAVLVAVSAAAEPINNADDRRDLARMVASAGMNCPVPEDFSKITENERGQIFRVQCLAADKQSGWTIRLIYVPNGPTKAEPW